MKNTARHPPTTAEEFRALLLERYDGLSKRLKQVARYVLDEPNELALETLAVIAERCGWFLWFGGLVGSRDPIAGDALYGALSRRNRMSR